MGQLSLPPKLYVDTAHLINIHRMRSGQTQSVPKQFWSAYNLLDECIRLKHFGVVFSILAPLDWIDGKATEESANEIASIIDSAKLHYLYEGDTWAYVAEVLRECTRLDSTLDLPDLPILHPLSQDRSFKPTLSFLANVPDYLEATSIPTVIYAPTARDFVVEAVRYKAQNLHVYQERVDGYRAALEQDIKHASLLSKGMGAFVLDWLKRFLKIDKVLEAHKPGIDADSLLENIQLERCPAVELWFTAREKRVRAGHPPDDNDVDDWMFLPVVPYVDLVLADRRFCTFLWQANETLRSWVTADPNQVRQILSDWLN